MMDFFGIMVIFLAMVGGVLVIAWGLDAYSTWRREHKRLYIRIRKLDDGRYYVRYYWSAWETEHREYVNAETLPAYLSDLALKSLEEGKA